MERLVLILLLIGCGFVTSGRAQELQPQDDIQSWNDLQLTVPLSKTVDFYTAVTGRFGKDVTRLNDGRYAIGFAWKPTGWLNIMPFYWYIDARNANSRFRRESRLNLRATFRRPVNKKVVLVHRSTYEYRMRRPLNSWRYRGALGFEIDIPKKIIPSAKIITFNEVFYDSLLERFSRNRFAIGISKFLNKNLTLDVSYMRQNDGVSRPGDLHVIWTAWRVKM